MMEHSWFEWSMKEHSWLMMGHSWLMKENSWSVCWMMAHSWSVCGIVHSLVLHRFAVNPQDNGQFAFRQGCIKPS